MRLCGVAIGGLSAGPAGMQLLQRERSEQLEGEGKADKCSRIRMVANGSLENGPAALVGCGRTEGCQKPPVRAPWMIGFRYCSPAVGPESTVAHSAACTYSMKVSAAEAAVQTFGP